MLGHADRGRSLRQAGVPAGSLRVEQRAICKCHSVDQGSGNRAGRVVGLDTLAALVVSSQYGACRSGNIGKCRTLRVSNRDPVRMAVAAIARSAPSIV